MKHIVILLSLLFSSVAWAEEDPFNHGRFYEAKMEISGSIIDIAGAMKTKPDKMMFEVLLAKRLEELKQKFPIDYTIMVSQSDGSNPNAPEMVAITLVGYQDEKGFIGWKFDTVFSDNMVFAFVLSLPDRNIPEISWEQYYRYKVIK